MAGRWKVRREADGLCASPLRVLCRLTIRSIGLFQFAVTYHAIALLITRSESTLALFVPLESYASPGIEYAALHISFHSFEVKEHISTATKNKQSGSETYG